MAVFRIVALHLNDQPGYLLNRTALLFRRELQRALREFSDMTPEQWQTLNTLWQAPDGLTPTEIAAVTLQDLPSISRMVARMEESGWVERQRLPEDRRSFRLRLTRRGRELERKIPARLQNHFEPYLGALSVEERRQLVHALRKLRSALGDSL